MKPDIVNLNWVGHGMLTVEAVSKISPPLVWTLHDVWPFTGGCHVNLACQGFQYSCGKCPQLGSDKGDDLSNQLWRQKEKMWRKLKLTLVAPSRWMAGVANNSSLLHNAKIEIIPHGLDTQIFHPWDKQKARHDLGVPLEKRLLLFGAASRGRHKGFSLLKEALQGLRPEMKNSLELLMFGPDQAVDLSGLDLPIHSFGSITDEKKLAQLYSAADLTVVPSLQESFGLVAVESLACATPVAAFAKTGLLDIVDHQKDGCLAEPFEAADLSSGIQWILEDDIRRDQLGENARNKVMKEYDIKLQAERYRALYSDLLQ